MPLRRGHKQRKLGFCTLTVHACDWGCPDETCAPAVWPPGCPARPCGSLCCAKGQCQFTASCLGLPELNLQLHPEPPALSASLSTWHELILLSPPWDCWAKGFQDSICCSSAIQLAFPPGQARQHAQVAPTPTPCLYEQHALS